VSGAGGEPEGRRLPPSANALHVVVVAYGPPASLAEALGALDDAHRAIVVDNSSSPATEAVVRRAGARYLDPGANLGFAGGVNFALGRRPGTGDVLLLNPDARITPDALAQLCDALAASPDAACAAPAQFSPGSGIEVRARWPWHTPGGAWAEALGLAGRRLRSARWFVGGAVLLLRGDALADVGPFDERFFLYGEDEDWEQRARRSGWRLLWCPEVRAEHGGGATDADRDRQRLRLHAATERYVRKWYGATGWASYRCATLLGLALRFVIHRGARRRADGALARIYLTGPDRAARRAGAVPDGRVTAR